MGRHEVRYPIKIEGTITTEDGQVSSFLVTEDGYVQWGNTTERLGDTVDVVRKLETLIRPPRGPSVAPLLTAEEQRLRRHEKRLE